MRLRAAAALLLVAACCGVLAAGSGAGPHAARPTGLAPRAAAPPAGLAAAVARVRSELRGVRQHGLVLGNPKAPLEIIEYANLLCAACQRVHAQLLPGLIARYVRTGRASLELRLVAEGVRSQELALGAYAATPQGQGWQYVQLEYLRSAARRGGATAGPAETPVRLAGALGLDRGRWAADLSRPQWLALLRAAVSVAAVAQFSGDPVFLIRRTAGRGKFVVLTEPRTAGAFSAAVARALRAPA